MPDPIVPPPTLPQGLGATLPVHARRGEYVPVVGGFLNVTLPGELVRSTVEKVLSRDVALVRIKSIVTHKAVHGFQQNSLVAVQRTQGELGERWTPVEEREVKEREEREKAARAARASEGEAHQEEAPVRKAKAK